MVEWRADPCGGGETGCDGAYRDATRHGEAVRALLRTGLQFLSEAMPGFRGRTEQVLVVIVAGGGGEAWPHIGPQIHHRIIINCDLDF